MSNIERIFTVMKGFFNNSVVSCWLFTFLYFVCQHIFKKLFKKIFKKLLALESSYNAAQNICVRLRGSMAKTIEKCYLLIPP